MYKPGNAEGWLQGAGCRSWLKRDGYRGLAAVGWLQWAGCRGLATPVLDRLWRDRVAEVPCSKPQDFSHKAPDL